MTKPSVTLPPLFQRSKIARFTLGSIVEMPLKSSQKIYLLLAYDKDKQEDLTTTQLSLLQELIKD